MYQLPTFATAAIIITVAHRIDSGTEEREETERVSNFSHSIDNIFLYSIGAAAAPTASASNVVDAFFSASSI